MTRRLRNALDVPTFFEGRACTYHELLGALSAIRSICCGLHPRAGEQALSDVLGEVGVIAGRALGVVPRGKGKWLPEDYEDLTGKSK